MGMYKNIQKDFQPEIGTFGTKFLRCNQHRTLSNESPLKSDERSLQKSTEDTIIANYVIFFCPLILKCISNTANDVLLWPVQKNIFIMIK